MNNIGDVQYTVDITVGGQQLRAIPDTGSFDLLVFSKRCVLCNDEDSPLYDDKISAHYQKSNFMADQTFGSGTTHSVEVYDTVQLGLDEVKHQVFWQVVGVDARFRTASFSAILGTGPPRSAAKIAEKEAYDIKAELANLKAKGENTVPYDKVVAHFEDVAVHAARQVPMLQELGTRTFSICLRPARGANGTWVWNDDTAHRRSELFMQVPVVGDMYWSAKLTDISLSFGAGLAEGDIMLGCDSEVAGDTMPVSGRCSAVVDSGTSLLVVPYEAYTKVHDALESLSGAGKDGCANLALLPDLKFRLGDMEFSLPPESYIGEVNGELSEELRDLMPHAVTRTEGGCMPMLMTLTEESEYGKVWILGMPLFRKYYTTFQLKEGSMAPDTMLFARSDESCNPTAGEVLRQERRHGIHEAQHLRVEADQIRVPSWISHQRQRRRLAETRLQRTLAAE